MALTLIGHYDSPFVRRVGISLHLLGMPFERQLLSVFGDADELRAYNPVGRVPALVLDDGEVLVDSAAILDHLDQAVGPERALLPAGGKARRDALQKVVLATGINDKAVAITYERRHRGDAADAGLDRPLPRPAGCRAGSTGEAICGRAPGSRLMQPEITVATMLGYLRLRQPETLPHGRYPALEALSAQAEGTSRLQGLPADARGDRRPQSGGAGRAFALAGRRLNRLRQMP